MSDRVRDENHVVIIGAGPAGLTAAYQLDKLDVSSTILEKDLVVGGLSRTVRHNGYLFDIGGHRFFTKVAAVSRMWREVLGDDLLVRQRRSRILYRQKFFDYPLRPLNALSGLGAFNSMLAVASYLKAKLFPNRSDRTFEDWISNRFGARLYRTFFKSYTEKVWGIPCNQISAEWAEQRIKGLSFRTTLKHALGKGLNRGGEVIKTLIHQFHYPRQGPGMMWERVAQQVEDGACSLQLGADVVRIVTTATGVESVCYRQDGCEHQVYGSSFISTMPVRELIEKMSPQPPHSILEAARGLRYRDFVTVALVVDEPDLFPDNWIYVHDPEVRVGRVQNFKNWSPKMVPNPRHTCLGLEYFCFENDDLWSMDDTDLIAFATKEIERLGLLKGRVVDGAVVRMPKAYPIYDGQHALALATIRGYLSSIGNLQLVGRNGMHKYNNQDHSMFTAMLAVNNLRGANVDLWSINTDHSYHEEATEADVRLLETLTKLDNTQPLVPVTMTEPGT